MSSDEIKKNNTRYRSNIVRERFFSSFFLSPCRYKHIWRRFLVEKTRPNGNVCRLKVNYVRRLFLVVRVNSVRVQNTLYGLSTDHGFIPVDLQQNVSLRVSNVNIVSFTDDPIIFIVLLFVFLREKHRLDVRVRRVYVRKRAIRVYKLFIRTKQIK